MKADPVGSSAPVPAAQLLRTAARLKAALPEGVCIDEDNDAAVAHSELQCVLKKSLLLDLEFALDNKVEQDLWNTVFKNQITIMQAAAKDKKNPANQKRWTSTLYVFLDSALGFYTLLLKQLSQAYSIELSFMRQYEALYGFTELPTVKASSASRSSCNYTVQYCLVHMGDIARYRNKPKMAESFYRHAVKLVPSSGQPYNQLALLEAQHGDRISPVYYYIRSIAVRTPFPAASTNLDKLYARLANQSVQPSGSVSASDYTVLFLQLHAMLHQQGGAAVASLRVQRQITELLSVLHCNLVKLLLDDAVPSRRLIQMLVITVYAIDRARGAGTAAEVPSSDGGTDTVYMYLVQLLVNTLDALLSVTYRIQEQDKLTQYSALPAVKLYLSWLASSPHILSLPPFTESPQIWSHLCQLINRLKATNTPSAAELNSQLCEDEEVSCFLPLSASQRGLKPSSAAPSPSVQLQLRLHQLRQLCAKLSRHGVVWTAADGHTYSCSSRVDIQLVLKQLQQQLQRCQITPSISPSGSVSSVRSSSDIAPLGSTKHGSALSGTAAVPTQAKRGQAGIITGVQINQPPATPTAAAGALRNRRQNVALQTIMRSQDQTPSRRHPSITDHTRGPDNRQVKFRTPSPRLMDSAPTPSAAVDAPPRYSPPPRLKHLQQQRVVRQSTGWPPPPRPCPLEPPAAPPTAPPAAPARFNPSVPPPGWSGPAGDPLQPAWATRSATPAQPAAQLNPLALILSQYRPADEQQPRYSLFPDSRPQPPPAGYQHPAQRPAAGDPSPALSYSLFPTAALQQQSLWPVTGPSPLERLIQQQRQRQPPNT